MSSRPDELSSKRVLNLSTSWQQKLRKYFIILSLIQLCSNLRCQFVFHTQTDEMRGVTHTVEYDTFIKNQLALRNWLSGLMWCKFGHVTPRNPAPTKPFRTPPCGRLILLRVVNIMHGVGVI